MWSYQHVASPLWRRYPSSLSASYPSLVSSGASLVNMQPQRIITSYQFVEQRFCHRCKTFLRFFLILPTFYFRAKSIGCLKIKDKIQYTELSIRAKIYVSIFDAGNVLLWSRLCTVAQYAMLEAKAINWTKRKFAPGSTHHFRLRNQIWNVDLLCPEKEQVLSVMQPEVIYEIDVESIFSDRFITRSRINALSAHAQTLLSCLKHMVLDRLRVRLNVILFIFWTV